MQNNSIYLNYLKYVNEHRKNVKKAGEYWKKRLGEQFGLANAPAHSEARHEYTRIKNNIDEMVELHDISKYSKEEFVPYADWFMGEYGKDWKKDENLSDEENKKAEEIHKKKKEAFEKAWQHHYRENWHHWNHFCYGWAEYPFNKNDSRKLQTPVPMPSRRIIEMVIDWTAMGYKFGNTAEEYYEKNKKNIELHPRTRAELESLLNGSQKYWVK